MGTDNHLHPHAVLDRIEAALDDPSTPVTMVPQLLGVAARVAATIARLKLTDPRTPPAETSWRPDPIGGHPELPPIPIPVAVWGELDPEDERVSQVNRTLTARAAIWHAERAAELEAAAGAEALAAVAADLAARRAKTREGES
jgi:hypothetical protein